MFIDSLWRVCIESDEVKYASRITVVEGDQTCQVKESY